MGQYKVMREDGIYGCVRCVATFEDKAEAQLCADRLRLSDRIGNYYYWVEQEEQK